MRWETHATVAANSIWVATLFAPVDITFLWLMVIAGFAGLAPDIDATNAKIHYLWDGLLKPLRNIARHRGFFHSFLVVAIIYGLTYFFLSDFHPLLPLVISLGYLSHLIIDGFNHPGVEYFWPIRKRIRLIPKKLRTPVKGFTDNILLLFATIGVITFIAINYSTFSDSVRFDAPSLNSNPQIFESF